MTAIDDCVLYLGTVATWIYFWEADNGAGYEFDISLESAHKSVRPLPSIRHIRGEKRPSDRAVEKDEVFIGLQPVRCAQMLQGDLHR